MSVILAKVETFNSYFVDRVSLTPLRVLRQYILYMYE